MYFGISLEELALDELELSLLSLVAVCDTVWWSEGLILVPLW